MTRPECPDDPLRWLAFRYVADELGRDDRLAFEARLADDPDACAAVAEAVELLGACLALEPPVPAGRGSRRAVVGAAVALAAAAAVVLAMLPVVGDRPEGGDGVADAGETIALERAWSRLRRSDLAEGAIDPSSEGTGDPLDSWEGGPLAEHATPEIDEDAAPDPPSWLMAAVALDGRTPEGNPAPLEN